MPYVIFQFSKFGPNLSTFGWDTLYMNSPLPVIDWSQRRHCDSAKLAISAKIKAIDNIQNLIMTAGVYQRKNEINEDATLIHKKTHLEVKLSIKHAQTELRGWF